MAGVELVADRPHLIGVSGASQPGVPAINTIRLGEGASRLLFPVIAGSLQAMQ